MAAYVLNGLINEGHGKIAEEHWAGDGDLLAVIQRILEVADSMIGEGIWKQVKKYGDGGGADAS